MDDARDEQLRKARTTYRHMAAADRAREVLGISRRARRDDKSIAEFSSMIFQITKDLCLVLMFPEISTKAFGDRYELEMREHQRTDMEESLAELKSGGRWDDLPEDVTQGEAVASLRQRVANVNEQIAHLRVRIERDPSAANAVAIKGAMAAVVYAPIDEDEEDEDD